MPLRAIRGKVKSRRSRRKEKQGREEDQGKKEGERGESRRPRYGGVLPVVLVVKKSSRRLELNFVKWACSELYSNHRKNESDTKVTSADRPQSNPKVTPDPLFEPFLHHF